MFVRCVVSTPFLTLFDRLPTPSKRNRKRAPTVAAVAGEDDDVNFCHPFVILTKVPLQFGCPPSFTSGEIVWNSMMTGRAGDATIRTMLTEFLALHHAGASLQDRQDKLREMWARQYNHNACVFLAYFMCATLLKDVAPSNVLKRDAINYLIDENIPFIPWDIFQDFIQRLKVAYIGKPELMLPTPPPVDWEPVYEDFVHDFPFNRDNIETPASPNIGNSVGSARSQYALEQSLAGWQQALDGAKAPGLSQEENAMFRGDAADAEVKEDPSTARELMLRDQLLAQRDEAMVANAKAQMAQGMRLLPSTTTIADPSRGSLKKRPRDPDSDGDDEEARPKSGLLAHERFMRAMRKTIERSDYINFASMSKERLDQLHVLGVGPANSKRLSASTVLVSSATEADVKILTYDYDAISSGFLYTYITLLSESSFDNAMTRVKDRLAWWQWLTSFFADNKPAAVKFIHWFMLEHHAEELWTPVTKAQCVLLAIKAKEECPPLSLSSSSRSGQPPQSKTPKANGRAAKVRPGPGTLTVNGGTTFTPSQTAKLVQWRSRFPGSCASRMTKEYTCSKEKRGLPCKFKHVCVWCSSASCKAACSGAEKL